MKPAAFDYVRAASLEEALNVLAQEGADARVIAGGQSLMAMLNMRLARPKVLVDIMRISALDRIEETGGPNFYRERLDALWDIFGEDHVLYASDWPNSDHHATYQETISIVRNYVEPKGRRAEEKFFWKNSVAAYRWHRRQADQPA